MRAELERMLPASALVELFGRVTNLEQQIATTMDLLENFELRIVADSAAPENQDVNGASSAAPSDSSWDSVRRD